MQDIQSNRKNMKECLDDLDAAVENVELFFSNTGGEDLPKLLAHFHLLKTHKEWIESLSKRVGAVYQTMSYTILPDLFVDKEVDSIKTGGNNFILSARFNASIPVGKKPEAYDWLESVGLGDLIQPNVNAKTLSSAVTNYFEEHAKLPPEDIIKIHKQPYIQVRKS